MSFYNDRKDAMAKPKNNNTSCEELLRFGDISETAWHGQKVAIAFGASLADFFIRHQLNLHQCLGYRLLN